MLHAELGRVPIEIQIKSRMINYWITLVNGDNTNKLSKIMYNIMLDETNNRHSFKWLDNIKNILISVGKPDLINQPHINNPNATKLKIVSALNDLAVQDWYGKLNQSSKGRNYNL